MPLPKQSTFAVFGATGGCAANALVPALLAGLDCIAMVRTPTKLRTMLEEKYSVPPHTLETHLEIVQGNVKSVDDVKRALTIKGRLPDRILFAVGGAPSIQLNPFAPFTIDDLHICEDGMKALVAALRSCVAEHVPLGPSGTRPYLIAISTVSMSNLRDMPYSLYPVEYWLVRIPRADKIALEKVVFAAATEIDSPLGSIAMVRPPLLLESKAKGLNNIDAGWVWPDAQRAEKSSGNEKETGPKQGFSIAKADVGAWIYENLIQGDPNSFGKCWNFA